MNLAINNWFRDFLNLQFWAVIDRDFRYRTLDSSGVSDGPATDVHARESLLLTGAWIPWPVAWHPAAPWRSWLSWQAFSEALPGRAGLPLVAGGDDGCTTPASASAALFSSGRWQPSFSQQLNEEP